ncbi:WcbI family polysaccharide biosynthesis putative acetyltransferase [Belnapia moabensis]|uniref:WcbI family polysaccharide biosynthesis putative acetyltransferase n=1 Tax=Belnapia moabensis TaxID=365533 RepID=UPI0005BA790C|nr:WcbI family polysaccharide biosynthesis putative acetyltransferase [Belnapia moabensis]
MKAFFSAEDIVEALYQGLLQRGADPEGLATYAAELRRDGLGPVIGSLLGSEEFRNANGLGGNRMLTIVGNCNAPVLANCLRSGSNAWVRWVADVNDRGRPHFDAAMAAMNAGMAGDIISVPFGEDYPDLSSSRIRALNPGRFHLMTNIHFTGLHPDITYFGPFGRRIHSAIGEYNSRIVLLCFLRNMSERDCLARFNARTYEALGYFRAWDESADELRRRDRPMNITFADAFLEITRQEQTLYSMNHPTSIAIASQAECIARALGLGGRFLPDAFHNPLADQVHWPIYPEIGEANRLRYETAFRFGTPSSSLGLEEFVYASYRRYATYGLEAMRQAARPDDRLDRDI